MKIKKLLRPQKLNISFSLNANDLQGCDKIILPEIKGYSLIRPKIIMRHKDENGGIIEYDVSNYVENHQSPPNKTK